MGHWFGKFDSSKTWRKTPATIGGQWYTTTGKVIRNPESYFDTVRENGRYWEGNTGWKNSSGKSSGRRSSNNTIDCGSCGKTIPHYSNECYGCGADI